MRQGNDVGTQYRSGIYATTPAQKKAAEESRAMYGEALAGKRYGTITTEVLTPAVLFRGDPQRYLSPRPRPDIAHQPGHQRGVSDRDGR